MGNGRSGVYEPVSEMYASCKCQMLSNTLGGSGDIECGICGMVELDDLLHEL